MMCFFQEDCCRWHQLSCSRGQNGWVTIKSWRLGYNTLR